MSSHLLQLRSGFVCQICRRGIQKGRRKQFAFASAPSFVSFVPLTREFTASGPRRLYPATKPPSTILKTASPPSTSRGAGRVKDKGFGESQSASTPTSITALISTAQKCANELLNSKTIPSEEQTLETLQAIESAAQQLTLHAPLPSPKAEEVSENSETDPASALLGLSRKQGQTRNESVSVAATVDLLSTLAYSIVKHQPVFLSPPILSTYVSLQAILQRPSSYPEVFYLYSHKPVPIPGSSSPIRYKQPNPDSPRQAVPPKIADAALDVAIKLKALELSLDIIDMSYTKLAFKRNKFIKRALLPISCLSLSPVPAYMIGRWMSTHVVMLDPHTVTVTTFVGIMTYLTAVTTLGYVALTTRNDQMERVTWVIGTGLTERWFREEERAAVDKVACAWGFKDPNRRGEEEGETWAAFKEWAALRYLEVDRTELMPGME